MAFDRIARDKSPTSSPGAPGLSVAFAVDALAARLGAPDEARAPQKAPPPVDAWNPPYCGEIDMRIGRDGAWFYQGSPILRPALVRLFASILRKDPDRYVLVTPVERVGITVEDAPFLAVEMRLEGVGAERILWFRTNVEDWVAADAEHPLRFDRAEADGFKPYVHVRRGLWALVTRLLALDLAALGEFRDLEAGRSFGVASAGSFFPICDARDLETPDLKTRDLEKRALEAPTREETDGASEAD